MTISHSRLLIVDNDSAQLAQLADNFARYGLIVVGVETPLQMRAALAQHDYALVVLDPAIAPEKGAALLHELAIERHLPVIVHSAACGEADRIAALELGAEDCLCKPANPRELLARIRAALRGRMAPGAPLNAAATARSFASFDGWRVDMTTGQLFDPKGTAVSLSDGEFQLLRVFVEHPRQVLDRSRLLDRVHGATADHYDRSIDVQLCRLRRKLSACGLKGPVIRTIRNEGYMFVHAVTN
ncbi:winged helix-turn-helix domain-containing protein [Sphingobium cupriresistens]|uniref:Transcriptional regulator n=1 Tax=Sphingobium cupriresistens LL01 TaxID=1420583 RepID=A0A0J8AIS2_9SPHN|nr:response regulator transcription factor [Sphingobium cupriresistens]KMS54630.1 transcriptional regulator [Sphingobium cupriresistens LL01]